MFMMKYLQRSMAAIRGFIATSLDGYIADRDGKVDWLKPFESAGSGYTAFIAEIETVVMGRTTYDQIRSFDIGWPYPGKRGIVVTSNAISHAPDRVEAWHEGVEKLIPALRAFDNGDVWIVGGAQLQSAFLAAGELDQLELFIIPLLLGDGVPLFPKGNKISDLQLNKSETLASGVVRLDYDLRANQ